MFDSKDKPQNMEVMSLKVSSLTLRTRQGARAPPTLARQEPRPRAVTLA